MFWTKIMSKFPNLRLIIPYFFFLMKNFYLTLIQLKTTTSTTHIKIDFSYKVHWLGGQYNTDIAWISVTGNSPSLLLLVVSDSYVSFTFVFKSHSKMKAKNEWQVVFFLPHSHTEDARHHLVMWQVNIETDHEPLSQSSRRKNYKTSKRLQWMRLALKKYHPKLQYQKNIQLCILQEYWVVQIWIPLMGQRRSSLKFVNLRQWVMNCIFN